MKQIENDMFTNDRVTMFYSSSLLSAGLGRGRWVGGLRVATGRR